MLTAELPALHYFNFISGRASTQDLAYKSSPFLFSLYQSLLNTQNGYKILPTKDTRTVTLIVKSDGTNLSFSTSKHGPYWTTYNRKIHNTENLRNGYYDTVAYWSPTRSRRLHTYLANIPYISNILITLFLKQQVWFISNCCLSL